MFDEKCFKCQELIVILVVNKRANFDYEILKTFQAGLSLSGKMVKQIKSRRVNLEAKFIVWQKNRLEIIGFGNEYLQQNIPILLKKREMSDIHGQLTAKGISCIPLNIKVVGRWLKADIALVKGKKKFDKREDLKKKDIDREIQREYKTR